MKLFRFLAFGVLFAPAACADTTPDDTPPPPPPPPDIVRITPVDGTSNVSIASRVLIEINRADAQEHDCRFSIATTTITVSQAGVPVEGTEVFYVGGLAVDFTPLGLFSHDTAYDVEVEIACAATATASFTTVPPPTTSVSVAVGDTFRLENLDIDEPTAMASLLTGFFGDANLVVTVMELQPDRVRFLSGEGFDVDPATGLRGFTRGGFLFPLEGVMSWPYFRGEGSMIVPVDAASDITMQHFEISGELSGTSPDSLILNGAIRAKSPCADVCAVNDPAIQAMCNSRSQICDEEDNLNLIGTFTGAANDIRPHLTITMTSPDVDLAVDGTLDFAFSSAVTVAANGVLVELRDPAGTLVDGTVAIAGDGLSAVFTPAAPLTTATSYTALVVAVAATEFSVTTVP